MTHKKLLYIAGPYTHPDPVENTHNAIAAAEEIERLGVAVFIPHLSLIWHLVKPATISEWYERDLHLLERCDAVVRLPGASIGADRETAHAMQRNIPVFLWDEDAERLLYFRDDERYPDVSDIKEGSEFDGPVCI